MRAFGCLVFCVLFIVGLFFVVGYKERPKGYTSSPSSQNNSESLKHIVDKENEFRSCMRSCIDSAANQPPEKLCPMCVDLGAGDEFTLCVANQCSPLIEAGCKVCCEGNSEEVCKEVFK